MGILGIRNSIQLIKGGKVSFKSRGCQPLDGDRYCVPKAKGLEKDVFISSKSQKCR